MVILGGRVFLMNEVPLYVGCRGGGQTRSIRTRPPLVLGTRLAARATPGTSGPALGFRVWGLGFGVQGSGFRVVG